MICSNCLKRLSRQTTSSSSTARQLRRGLSQSIAHQSTTTPVTPQTSTATNPRPNGLPAATSTSAAQPFSTPLTPSLKRQAKSNATSSKSAQAARPPSSVPGGAVLRGLNYMKNKQDPVALEDDEYPDWLWGVLDQKASKEGDGEGEGDLFSKSKKQRRKAAKALRKRALMDPNSLVPKIPLYEQSIDLPAGNGTLEGAKAAAVARQDLTKAMRDNRRAKIKEDNFLRAMG